MAKPIVVLKKYVVDLKDQWIFLWLAFIGSVAIVVLKGAGANQFTVTAFPVTLVAGYGLFAFFTKRYRIREDKIGDNCYYLGFIYTLVSLSCALYVYDPSGAGVELIITNFGIALATTIIGLVGRIVFNQMREDPHEVEREIRYALGDAARDLRTELNDITSEMEDFKRKIIQIVQEGVVDIQKRAAESLEQNVGAFNASTRQVIETVDETLKGYEGTSRKMGEVAEMTVTAVTQLAKRVEAVNVSPEMVSGKLDPIIQQLGEIVDNVSKREASHSKALQALKKSLEASVASADGLHTAIEAGAASARKNLEDMLGGVGTIVQSAGAALEANRKMTTEMTAAVGAFKAEIGNLTSEVGGGIARVSQQTEELVNGMRAQQVALTEHARSVQKTADEGRRAVDEIQSSLVTLTRTVVDAVRA